MAQIRNHFCVNLRERLAKYRILSLRKSAGNNTLLIRGKCFPQISQIGYILTKLCPLLSADFRRLDTNFLHQPRSFLN
jgi:hypothetical protein